MAYLNVSNYNSNSGYNYVNVCNNLNDFAGFGFECLGNTTYQARMIGVDTSHNGETQHWVSFFTNQNTSNPITWSSTAITNFKNTFEGIVFDPPSSVVSPIVLYPYTENSTVSYNGYRSVVPDFSNPTYVSYNEWSSWSGTKTNLYITTIPVISSDDSGGDSVGDYAQITNAIILIPATIILVFFFKMIFNIFMNRKVRG